MSITEMNASDLINLAQDKLAGYQNAVDSRALLSYINEGKDELWKILKANNDDFFSAMSQSSDSTGDDYFGPLAMGVREYTLPADFSEIRFIECTTPSYEMTEWVFKKPSDPLFRESRKGATAAGASSNNNAQEFLYTIIGNQFVLATYPPAALNVTLWYTQGLADLEYGDPLPVILIPYAKSIATWASKAVMLSEDEGKFAEWQGEWKSSVISSSQTSGPRNQADPTFVEDFGDF